jgi:hypothetical protein
MADERVRTLNHLALFTFDATYWSASSHERQELNTGWLGGLREAAQRVDVYQVFPDRDDGVHCRRRTHATRPPSSSATRGQ